MFRKRAIQTLRAEPLELERKVAPLLDTGGPDGVQSIKRALGIIRYLASLPEEMGATVSQISAELRINRTTAHRIVNSLVEERCLQFHRRTGIYSVGPLPAALALGSINDFHHALAWTNTVEDIAKATNQTTYLMARSLNECVCLKKVYGDSVIRVAPFKLGHRLPVGVGPAGLALLSQFSENDITLYVNEFCKRSAFVQSFDNIEASKMLSDAMECKRQGYIVTVSKAFRDVFGLGFVLPGPHGADLAICITTPRELLRDSSVVDLHEIVRRCVDANGDFTEGSYACE